MHEGDCDMTVPEVFFQIASALLLPLCVVLIECIFALSIRYRVTLYHIVFSAFAPVVPTGLCLLIPNLVVRYILQGVLLIAILLLYLSQFIYYKIFQTLCITQSLKGAGKAMQFVSVVITKVRENITFVLFFLVPVILYFAAAYPLMHMASDQLIPQIALYVGLILLFLIMLVAGLLNRGEALSPRFLLKHAFMTEPSLKRFGLLMTMAIDVKVNVFGIVDETEPEVDLRKIRIVREKTRVTTSIPRQKETPVRDIKRPDINFPDPGPNCPDIKFSTPGLNCLDIDFPEETDKSFRAMHAYFSKRAATAKNPYTGYFQGKNLILITAESFSKYLIDPVLTPTLFRMASQGFQFKRFYTPLWGVSTSDGEFVATAGLIPKSGIWSYTSIANRK